MHRMTRQRGMTLIGWLIVLALIGFFTLLTLRLAPNYMEYASVVSVLKSVANEPGVATKPPAELRRLIDRRFDINNVSRVKARDIKIERTATGLRLIADYEVRVHVLGNVDVVTRFHKVVEAR